MNKEKKQKKLVFDTWEQAEAKALKVFYAISIPALILGVAMGIWAAMLMNIPVISKEGGYYFFFGFVLISSPLILLAGFVQNRLEKYYWKHAIIRSLPCTADGIRKAVNQCFDTYKEINDLAREIKHDLKEIDSK